MTPTPTTAPPSEWTTKAPRQLDRRKLPITDVVAWLRYEHGLPRRRAEHLARKCYRDAETARTHLPPAYVEQLFPPAVAYVRRIRRLDPTGERATD